MGNNSSRCPLHKNPVSLSPEIRREQRGTNLKSAVVVCLDTTVAKSCGCKRCTWFGSVDKRGIVSVADSTVKNSETVVLSRIQLCEHSMQNMNLFSGEFLSQGDFTVDILIDRDLKQMIVVMNLSG
ncbi:MAG: hypothetical protein GY749_18380 [Desulfobacteraceae bacterium]|nr:hypothetical protein [Desulfobacteraceae bacterium]